MSLDRRLAKLETSLSPKEAVLSWLADAQEFPTLPEYAGSLLDAPTEAWPLVRIIGRVEGSARAALKGRSGDEAEKALRRKVGEAFFLFDLVLRLNVAAEEMTRFEGLRWACLSYWLRTLTLEAELAEGTRRGENATPRPRPGAIDGLRSALASSLKAIYSEEGARAALERKYLDGRPALFSCLVGKWDEMRGRLEALDSFAAVSRGLRGSTAPALALQELQVLAANDVSARVGELADQARVMALDMLGDAEHAAVIAGRRLRTLPDFASGTSPAGVEGPRL